MTTDDKQPMKTNLMDVAAERERYKRKLERRTQDIRDAGDRWLAKLAAMPRDGGVFRK